MRKILFYSFIFFIFFIPCKCFSLSVSSYSAILMDSDSGRVIYSKNSDSKELIASTTKIMTAILAIESNKLYDYVEVGDEVLSMYGSNIYIEVGEKLQLIDLVYGLLLRSGNDSAVTISKYVGGNIDNFVLMMNEKAKNIGMTNTIFKNPHGLDEESENISTAYDMALLSSYAIKNDIYKTIVGTKRYDLKTNLKSYIWYNRNQLLKTYKYCIGGKTGYTPRAGKTLVTNSQKNGLNLTVVTFKDGNQYDTHKMLYEYGFKNYKKYKILDKRRFKIDDSYYKEDLYLKNDFYYVLTDLETNYIKLFIQLYKLGNYSNGEKVGVISVYLNDVIIHEEDVFVKIKEKSDTNRNIFKRIFAQN